MNVEIQWSPYSTDPGDVDKVYLFEVDQSLTSEKSIEDELQTNGVNSTLLNERFQTSDITVDDSFVVQGLEAGTYTFCLAAMNSAGWNVGASDASEEVVTADGATGSSAIARITLT